jgi:hypothetical protein
VSACATPLSAANYPANARDSLEVIGSGFRPCHTMARRAVDQRHLKARRAAE